MISGGGRLVGIGGVYKYSWGDFSNLGDLTCHYSAEAIPFLGVAVLIADTGYELYTACEKPELLD